MTYWGGAGSVVVDVDDAVRGDGRWRERAA